jgi:flagellar protein FlbD
MILLTRLNGSELVINAELIESVEATPDTVVTLTTGKRIIVTESVSQVSRRALAYRRAVVHRDLEMGC